MMRLTQDWTLPGSGSNQFRTGSALSIGALNQNQNLHDRGRTEPELNLNPEFSSPGSGSNLGSELNFGNPTKNLPHEKFAKFRAQLGLQFPSGSI